MNEPCVTKQGIALTVKAVIAAKIGNDQESIVNAAQRFLSDQDQMSTLTGRIFAGHLRSIIGSMTVEEIITERQKLATEVLDGSKEEMAKIGLIVDALQIQSIDDGGLGYIKAMAAPHNAAIQQRGADRAGGGRSGGGRGAAAVAAQAGRVRARDRRHPGRATRPRRRRPSRRRRRPARSPRPRRSRRSSTSRPASRSAGRAAPAAAGVRGRQAGRGRGRAGAHPRQGRRRAHSDPGGGGGVEQPRRAGPAAHRAAAADRREGRRRARQRERHAAQRVGRAVRGRVRTGRAGPGDLRLAARERGLTQARAPGRRTGRPARDRRHRRRTGRAGLPERQRALEDAAEIVGASRPSARWPAAAAA